MLKHLSIPIHNITDIHKRVAFPIHANLSAAKAGLLAIMLLIGSILRPPASALWQTAYAQGTAAGNSPNSSNVLECANTPFGNILTLREENEPMVSFVGGFGSGDSGIAHVDRFDLGSSQLFTLTASTVATYTEMQNVGELVSVMADLDGNGKAELVQARTKTGDTLRVASYNSNGTTDLYTDNHTTHRNISIAAGRILTNTAGTPRQQVAIASAYSQGGYLSVIIVGGDLSGGLMNSGIPYAAYYTSTNELQNILQTDIAVGDLDGDGVQNDLAVVYIQPSHNPELITLHYDAVSQVISPTGYHELNFGDANKVRIALANLDGDHRDEIIVAKDTYSPDSSLSPQVSVHTFDFRDNTPDTPGGDEIVELAQWTRSDQTTELALDSADTDNDGLNEIVLGYRNYGSDAALTIYTLDILGSSTISIHNQFSSTVLGRAAVQFLDVRSGDLNNDGSGDIIAAFRDSDNQVQALHLSDSFTPTFGISELGYVRNNQGGHLNATNISVAMGDWDDNSLRAHYGTPSGSTIQCKTVEEPNIVAAVFAPPYWDRLQGKSAPVPRDRRAWIGQSKGGSQSSESAITLSRNHSVSGYVGLKVGGEVAGVGLESEVRAKGGYEWNSSNTRRGGNTSTQTTNESWNSNDGSFVALERTTHDCYNYQLKQGATDLDAVFRFCEFKGYAEVATDLDNWDTNYGPALNPQALQWTPIARDWANLALFRGAAAVQSSTDGELVAKRAADGNTSGTLSQNSVARTANEAAAWWQIDLGKLQELRNVRLWNRDNVGCTTLTCSAALSNFYVFVSDTDFRDISNNPQTLAQSPLVWTQFYTASAGSIVNVQTFRNNKPIIGRYVRVQLSQPGALALAEVQVFGSNAVEPDRYPIAVSDPIKGDGWFNALVYDPNGIKQVVRMRGNLLWNGANDGVLASKRVTVGNVVADWSMEEERSKTSIESESLGNITRVGAEFDVSGGVGLQVTAGGGYEFSSGLLTESVRSTAWMTSFVIGGGVQGLPSSVDGVPLLSECEYGFQPYYYEVTDQANTGYQHRYIVVDYIVPDQSITRSSLDICRSKLRQPVIESQITSGAPGSLFILTAQGFPTNADVNVALKGPNQTGYITLTTLRMNANGTLLFVLKTGANDVLGDYSVQISTNSALTGANRLPNRANAVAATTTITLSDSKPRLTETGTGSPPVVSSNPQDNGRLFLPTLAR